MDRISSLQRKMMASIPSDVKMKYALGNLITSSLPYLKNHLNAALQTEFKKAGIDADAIDFYKLITLAVSKRFSRNSPDFDDLLQEVSINLLDRTNETKKDWIRKIKKSQDEGRMDNLSGFLFRAFQNFIRDISRKEVKQKSKTTQFTRDDEDESGIDLGRLDVGDNTDPESEYSAREIKNKLMRNLKWDKSRQILEILLEHGVTNILDKPKGGTEIARELGVTPGTVTTVYLPKFKADLIQALEKIKDRDLQEEAQQLIAASQNHPMIRLCEALQF
jgi:hypothetical protein